jgi:type IV pilus assembly protein PilO
LARAGALAVLARLPAQRKALLFGVIGLVIGLGYWKLVYKALDERLDQAQAEHAHKVQTNQRLAADLPKYEVLRTRMAKLRELIEKNQTALPNEAEVPAFFETLQHKVAESGVEIRKWTNRGEEPVESFVKVPVEVEMTGTFMQIKRFFASLIQRDVRPSQDLDERANEDHERIVSIEDLALTSPTVKNREIILTAKFTAVTFRQEDKPAGQPGAAKPAMPAAPKPATPSPASPPPLPSAATPAGAKVRVDKALDKGDARKRNGGSVGEPKRPAAGRDRLKGGL